MKKTLYTIGYAHHTQESFLELLLKYRIDCIVDVRTQPYSKFHMQFNKEPFSNYLKMHHIAYIHMEESFGIIYRDNAYLGEDGYLDFRKLSCSKIFEEGVKRVEKGLEKGYTIAFMCAEKDPIHCHRSTLVARAFYEMGYDIQHILHDGILENHKQMEVRMKDTFVSEMPQLDLFHETKSLAEPLEEAYRLCSKDIFVVNAKRVLKDDYDYPRNIKV